MKKYPPSSSDKRELKRFQSYSPAAAPKSGDSPLLTRHRTASSLLDHPLVSPPGSPGGGGHHASPPSQRRAEGAPVIHSWDLLLLSQQPSSDKRYLTVEDRARVDTEAIVQVPRTSKEATLEVYPLDNEQAQQVLSAKSMKKALKARIRKNGPTEEDLLALEALRQKEEEVSLAALQRGNEPLASDQIVLIRDHYSGKFLKAKKHFKVTKKKAHDDKTGSSNSNSKGTSTGGTIPTVLVRKQSMRHISELQFTTCRLKEDLNAPPTQHKQGLSASFHTMTSSITAVALFEKKLQGTENSLPVRLGHAFWFRLDTTSAESLSSIAVTGGGGCTVAGGQTTRASPTTQRARLRAITASSPTPNLLRVQFITLHHIKSDQYIAVPQGSDRVMLGSAAAATAWRLSTKGSRKSVLQDGHYVRLFHEENGYLVGANQGVVLSKIDLLAATEHQVHNVWQIELEHEMDSAEEQPTLTQNAAFHLRHVLTGLYATLVSASSLPCSSADSSTAWRKSSRDSVSNFFVLSLVAPAQKGATTLFSLHANSGQSSSVFSGDRLFLKHIQTGTCLHLVEHNQQPSKFCLPRFQIPLRHQNLISNSQEYVSCPISIHSAQTEALVPALTQLSNLFQAFSSFAHTFKQSKDFNKQHIKEVSRLLMELIQCCVAKDADPFAPDTTPIPLYQAIFGQAYFIEGLIDALIEHRDYVGLLEKHIQRSGGKTGATRMKYALNICRLIARLLYLIVRKNFKNSELVSSYFPRLVTLVGQKVTIADVMVEIFQQVDCLSEGLKEEHILPIMEQSHSYKATKYASMLVSICTFENRPIVENQNIIVSAFRKFVPFQLRVASERNDMVEILLVPNNDNKWVDLIPFVHDFSKESDIRWFEQMLVLFARVSQGANEHAARLIARILPFKEVFACIRLEGLPQEIKQRFYDILITVYAPFYPRPKLRQAEISALTMTVKMVAGATGETQQIGGGFDSSVVKPSDWSNLKGFLLQCLGQHQSMMYPANLLFVSILNLVGRLVLQGCFVEQELDAILQTFPSILLFQQPGMEPNINRSLLTSVHDQETQILEQIKLECCKVVNTIFEYRTVIHQHRFDLGLHGILLKVLQTGSASLELAAIRLLMRNLSHVFGDHWMLFEDSFLPILHQWGEKKAMEFVYKMKLLLKLIAKLYDSKGDKEQFIQALANIIKLITQYFLFIVPPSIRPCMKQMRRLTTPYQMIYDTWLQDRQHLNFAFQSGGQSALKEPLKVVPPEIVLCRSLRILHLCNNELTTVPSEIGILSNLETLDLSNNQIAIIPSEISKLDKLKTLNLSSNAIDSLPHSIGYMRNLQVLNLHLNPLREFLASFDRLNKTNNTDAAPRSPRGNATSTSASVPSLKEQSQQAKKETIQSELDDVGQSMAPVVALINQVKLPTTQDTASVLAFLRVMARGTVPFNRIRLLCVGEENVGKTSLIQCFKQQTHLQREFSLASLKVRKRKKAPATLATDGILIEEWKVKCTIPSLSDSGGATGISSTENNTREVTFSAWDFAGQEVYYTTHQFFLSTHSIYMVVFNMSKDVLQESRRLDYWLQSIQTKAPGSPVFIVGTHADSKKCTKEYSDTVTEYLMEKYIRSGRWQHITAIQFVSCKTGRGIAELHKNMVAVAYDQPYMKQNIPKNYVELEKQIKQKAHAYKEQRQPPIIAWSDFVSMATDCGIHQSDVSSAAAFMNDLGVIVHSRFRKMTSLPSRQIGNSSSGTTIRGNARATEFENIVILDPQYLARVMSSIISLKHNFVRHGILKHRDLQLLWKAPEFRSCKSLLLSLLQHFDIIFTINPEKSLVPTLLPSERPSNLYSLWYHGDYSPDLPKPAGTNDFANKSDHNKSHDEKLILGRVFSFKFVPLGFFGRIIVRILNTLYVSLDLFSQSTSSTSTSPRQSPSSFSSPSFSSNIDGEIGTDSASYVDSALYACGIRLVWYNGILAQIGDKRALIEFHPDQHKLCVFYCYDPQQEEEDEQDERRGGSKSASPRSGTDARSNRLNTAMRVFTHIIHSINNIISEWYQVASEIDIVCSHCLTSSWMHHKTGGVALSSTPGASEDPLQERVIAPVTTVNTIIGDATMWRLNFCESQFYRGNRFVYCDRRPASQQQQVEENSPRAAMPDVTVEPSSSPSIRSSSKDPMEQLQMELQEKLRRQLGLDKTNNEGGSASTKAKENTQPQQQDDQSAVGFFAETERKAIFQVALPALVPDVTMTSDDIVVIPMSHLDMQNEVGRGGFATVYKAIWNRPNATPKHVAVKQLHMTNIRQSMGGDDAGLFAEFRKEVWTMSGLEHPNIVELYGIVTQPLSMVMDFMADGSLESLLTNEEGIALDWKVRFDIALQVARGMNFLHTRRPPIIHRDLKSANVLVSIDKNKILCKIADFGSSVAESRIRRRVVDNPVWCAPEVLRGEEYTEKVDVYSYGMLLYELATRQKPFLGVKWWHLIEDMVKAGERPKVPSTCPKSFQKLMELCWADNENSRPPFDDVITMLLSMTNEISSHAHS
ncbi:Pleckstrin y domain [Balamuthia mandrillaris]